MEWVWFSAITVLLWGSSDIIFKKSSVLGGDNTLKLLAYNGIILGGCALVYWAVMTPGGFRFSIQELGRYLPVAVIFLTSMFFYYKMLPLIKLSIASPIANSSCLFVTLLCVFVLRQEIAPIQWAAVGVIVIGLMILSRNTDSEGEKITQGKRLWPIYALGILCALAYSLLDAVGSFFDNAILGDYELNWFGSFFEEPMAAEQAFISYGLIYLVVGLFCLAVVKRRQPHFRFFSDKYKLTGSVIESAGQLTYMYAFAFGDAALASPFIACFAVVSVVGSAIFLKERLKPFQYAVVALMFAGMIVLGWPF